MQSRRDPLKTAIRKSALPVPSSESISESRASFSLYLVAARESCSLSLDDIAAKTRIPTRSLELIEAGEFEKLPADVFVRGFLRSYARCVGLDAEETIRRYADCGMTPAPVASPMASSLAGAMATMDSGNVPSYRVRPLPRSRTETGTADDIDDDAKIGTGETSLPDSAQVPAPHVISPAGEPVPGSEQAATNSAAVEGDGRARVGRSRRERTAIGVEVEVSQASENHREWEPATAPDTVAATVVTPVVTIDTSSTIPDTCEGVPAQDAEQVSISATSEVDREAIEIIRGPDKTVASGLPARRGEHLRCAYAGYVSTGAQPQRSGRAVQQVLLRGPNKTVASGLPARRGEHLRYAYAGYVSTGAQPQRSGRAVQQVLLGPLNTPVIDTGRDEAGADLVQASPAGELEVAAAILDTGAATTETSVTGAVAAGDQTANAALMTTGIAATAAAPDIDDGAAKPRKVMPPPVLVIDDEDPEEAERAREERVAADREDPSWRQFLPQSLLDGERGSRRGALTLAVIILVIVATLTMSYLLRRPSYSGDGVTQGVLTPDSAIAGTPLGADLAG